MESNLTLLLLGGIIGETYHQQEIEMPKAINETGNRYGKLVVTKRHDAIEKKRACWLCECDCGNTAVVSGQSLRNGNTRSCGCLVSEVARETKADPPTSDLRNLSTEALCKKYDISRTTAWRYRDKVNIKEFGPSDPIASLSETDKAYLAGLIDADGHIIIKTVRDTAYPGIGVNQCDFQALEWMADKLKATVSFHTRRKEGKSGYQRKQMIVRLHGTRAQLLCAAILPYLKIKKRQAEIILQFPCDARDKGLSEAVNIVRFELRSEIHKLNQRE